MARALGLDLARGPVGQGQGQGAPRLLLAARAGVARATVYRRWSSLPALCMEALEHVREPFPELRGVDVAEDLVTLLQALRHLLTESTLGRLLPQLAVEAGRHPDLSVTYWNDYLVRGSSAFGDVLRRGVTEGLLRPDLDVELESRVGHVTGELLRASVSDDLLVVGSRGHGRAEDLFIGSVSQHLARHAPCPVVLTGPEADTEPDEQEG